MAKSKLRILYGEGDSDILAAQAAAIEKAGHIVLPAEGRKAEQQPGLFPARELAGGGVRHGSGKPDGARAQAAAPGRFPGHGGVREPTAAASAR